MRQLKITQSITNRASASLEKYLQDIAHEELLSTDEEVELAQRIRKGDRRALERLTKANLRFVVSVAKQYQNQGLTLPDLINEGNVGLIKAAQKFDETRGFKFISYAVWWIRQSILQALNAYELVRTPDKNIYQRLDDFIGDSYDREVDFLEDRDSVPTISDARTIVDNLLKNLDNPRTKEIIKNLYGIDTEEKSKGRTAQLLGIAEETVRLHNERGLNAFRQMLS